MDVILWSFAKESHLFRLREIRHGLSMPSSKGLIATNSVERRSVPTLKTSAICMSGRATFHIAVRRLVWERARLAALFRWGENQSFRTYSQWTSLGRCSKKARPFPRFSPSIYRAKALDNVAGKQARGTRPATNTSPAMVQVPGRRVIQRISKIRFS